MSVSQRKMIPSEIVDTAIVMYAAVRYTEMKRTDRFSAAATRSPTSIVPGTKSAV